jgi:superfamily II DNA or RNA helicase
MFPTWRGQVRLPPLPLRRQVIGQNTVFQQPFRGAVTQAELLPSQVPGYDLLTTRLLPPFDELLVRRSGTRRRGTNFMTLHLTGDATFESGAEMVALGWDVPGEFGGYAADPDAVLALWRNRFDFREEDENGESGLRLPQIASLHAISAHFAIGASFEPATVVLPTGTGKTETMLATHIYRGLRRVLVLVPSIALRQQIARKFLTLGVLPDTGVIPRELPGPFVASLARGLRTSDQAEQLLASANVIVSLPESLRACAPDALTTLLDGCSDIIVDEAHHVPAATWSAIRGAFVNRRVLQFTATPFRRDGKRVDGKIIFNFRLGDAQDAGYYRSINLRTVEEYGDEGERDRAIALAAVAALRRDRDELGLNHLMMVRTRTRERAEAVARIYEKIAPDLRPVIVYSGSGRVGANRRALAQLTDQSEGGSRIVVCVDMLGEGFDLPELKVAALHDVHKSLAVTLQFIGRFTRKGAQGRIGDATAVVNIADPEVEDKLAALYAEGADWDKLIRRLSEERVDEELRLQAVVESLKGQGDLHERLSLWNLRPALSTQIYRTSCIDWNPRAYRTVLPAGAESWFALDEDDQVLVAVVDRTEEVGWGNYQDIRNRLYDLIIAKWDRIENALFLHASDYDAMRSQRLALEISGGTAVLVSGEPIFRILNNVELPLVKSLGSSRVGAISFTTYFGSNVTEGLASIEKAESALNNIACLGYEDGEKVLWGAAQRSGKVWQQRKGTIAEWLEWASRTWLKVSSESTDEANITRDFLRPARLDGPYDSHPIAAQWGEIAQATLSDRLQVLFGDVAVPRYLVDVDILESEADGAIRFAICTDTQRAVYRLTISSSLNGGYGHEWIEGSKVRIRRSTREPESLEEYLAADPLIIRYVDGTQSYNCYHIPIKLGAGAFARDLLESWDWSGIPLNRESMGKGNEQATIQYRTFKRIESEFDLIFNDDGSGEAADLVALREEEDGSILLCLVHCKNAHEGRVSGDIRNFYYLCGQAQKSVAIRHAGLKRLYHDLRRRHETWAREGASRFLKGDLKRLSYYKERSAKARLSFEVILVQPGTSPAMISDDALRLIGTTELYLTKTAMARFRVITS